MSTLHSICCDSSQDGSTFILRNIPHGTTINSTRNAPAEAMNSTHSRDELNRINKNEDEGEGKAPPITKKHVETQPNGGIIPIPALFIEPYIATIILFIKSFIGIKSMAFSDTKAFLVVLLALSVRPNSALSLSTFGAHTCALHTDSTPSGFNAFKCWGENSEGQCGYENRDYIADDLGEMGANLSNIDTNISLFDIKQVETGKDHTCLLTEAGEAKCWGKGSYGALGYGNTDRKGAAPNTMGVHLPFIDFGESWRGTQIALGFEHTCVLMNNGTTLNGIKCWGRCREGRLGLEISNCLIGYAANQMGDNLPFVKLGTGFNPIQVIAGSYFTCALSGSNKVKCWGLNRDYGILGIGDTVNRGEKVGDMGDNLPFVDLGTGFTPIRLFAGAWHSCALSGSNQLKCWGRNEEGQLGIGDSNNRGDVLSEMGDALPFVDLGSNLVVTQLTGGEHYTCALFSVGNIKCWGIGKNGILGSGNTTNIGDKPDQMGDNLPFVDLGSSFAGTVTDVAAGYYHACASNDYNEVKCWGEGGYGRLGAPMNWSINEDMGDVPTEMGDGLPFVDLGFPTANPSTSPTFNPSRDPSTAPTDNPSTAPTKATKAPTDNPSTAPTDNPTTVVVTDSVSIGVNWNVYWILKCIIFFLYF
eukprot:235605_1